MPTRALLTSAFDLKLPHWPSAARGRLAASTLLAVCKTLAPQARSGFYRDAAWPAADESATRVVSPSTRGAGLTLSPRVRLARRGAPSNQRTPLVWMSDLTSGEEGWGGVGGPAGGAKRGRLACTSYNETCVSCAKKIVLCRADDRRATPPSANLRLLLAEAERRLG